MNSSLEETVSPEDAGPARATPQLANTLIGPLLGALQGPQPGHVRLMTLVMLRWLAVVGQLVALFTVHFGLGFPVKLLPCVAVVGASALLNVVISLRSPVTKRLSDQETTFYLGFDIVQLTALLGLTGGLENPFAVLLLAPVVVAASTLPLRNAVTILIMSLALMTALAFVHMPLPWRPGAAFRPPNTYVWGIWCALMMGLSFTAVYAWRIATEARRMSDALLETQAILVREHQLAAVGGLAAAAAHELGTPLATIALVAKELRRALPKDGPVAEDIQLMVSQVDRCRDILSRLSMRPDEGDSHVAMAPLSVVLDEVVSPHRDFGIDIAVEVQTKGPEPTIRRSPELLHALGNLVENAVDFARTSVRIGAAWDRDRVTLTIADDGPGFALSVIDRLGEPYLTTRALPTNLRRSADDDDRPQGMGLGFFIAKTLIERIGGSLAYGNRGGAGGALVRLTWPRPLAPDGQDDKKSGPNAR